ncbi:MAG: hypothetical protein ACD_60C00075G0004 [uncultured bacterium]|nr:MAG: hypothetical protein ACD_60C00075G0004 [uncultured bacterium]
MSSNRTESKQDSYELCFLKNGKLETLAEAHMRIKGGNAVLLCPPDSNSNTPWEQRYHAYFILEGQWAEKDEGFNIVSLPSSLDLKNQNKDAIIQMALSQAGIIKDPSTIPLKQQPSESKLSLIANDMMEEAIFPFPDSASLVFPDSASLVRFSITCRQANEDVGALLYRRKLLQHIIYGKKDEAEAMLKQASWLTDKTLLSKLLLKKDTVASYSFGLDKNNPVKMKGTALQIAAGADDFDVIISGKKVVDGMSEMIASYLRQLPEGEAEIAKQMNERFPDEKSEEERCLRDIEALNKVVKAIEDATDAECNQALAEFRQYLEPKGVITTGKQFNEKLLLHALDLYIEKYAAFGNEWRSLKNLLFWEKIICYIRRFLPANLAQTFAGNDKNLKRSLGDYFDTSFFPLNDRFSLDANFPVRTYSSDYPDSSSSICLIGSLNAAWAAFSFLSKIMLSKNSSIKNLFMEHPANSNFLFDARNITTKKFF